MIKSCTWFGIIILAFLATGCSSTTMVGSWKNPEFSEKVERVYVVGISKDESLRNLFEDQFSKALDDNGLFGYPSHNDLSESGETAFTVIIENARKIGADSILITGAIGTRTKDMANPRLWYYTTNGPQLNFSYKPTPYYKNFNSYYKFSNEIAVDNINFNLLVLLIFEANLYDRISQQLIWSAQLETQVKDNINKQISDFINVVTEDLKKKGLI